MKNYFTDEQAELIFAEAITTKPGDFEYKHCLTQSQLRALMNLAVSTAIGEPICHVADFTIDSIVDNPEDGLCMVKTKRYPYEIPLFRIAALESPQDVTSNHQPNEKK